MAEALAGLEPALAGYRSAGHRIGESQQLRGVDDISVPILSPEGYAIAVLTCPYIQRLDNAQADITQTLALLKDVAAKLSLS
jgi:DNA-binding IclR family transcriptional regulator